MYPDSTQYRRELFARYPIAGERPSPQFLLFDGQRLDLADASIDRIIVLTPSSCAEPRAVWLTRRVLAAGASPFCGTRPEHSLTPQSQLR